MFFGKKKNPHDNACFACHIVVTVLLFLATLAALLETVMAHYLIPVGMREYMFVFGTNAGALSLIAFAVTVSLWVKSLKACITGCEACGTIGKK
ncbi:MAG: hypothetical protein HOO67_01655 [Candidatus Peribacteraceae bacterium]|nr:hypothetical protein [Candidatus Peribacteraceae bacterium]